MDILKICTYNIRYDNLFDKKWGWENRKSHILDLIKYEKFDLFGIQEALLNQLNDLKSISEYNFFGVARGDGLLEDEFNGIFYNKNKFEKIDGGYFWLSKTPEIPSIYEGAGCKRVCVWLILLNKLTNKKLAFAVTHLDNLSKEARIFSANLILEKLKPYYKKYPFALMGDFNSLPEDDVYKNLTKVFNEVKILANIKEKATFTSDSNFLINSDAERCEIDFIFLNNKFDVKNVEILKNNFEGKYISDHFPVVANIIDSNFK